MSKVLGSEISDDTGSQVRADQEPATLLIYVSVPLHERNGVLNLEDQACNGLRLWASKFERLIVVIPLATGTPPAAWVPLAPAVGAAFERIELVIVPEAYRADRFLRALPRAIPRLRDAIHRADYLGFAIGGFFGDWGAVCAILAHRAGLPFYVWTDRVESEVVRLGIRSETLRRRRLKSWLMYRPTAWMEHYLIRRAAVGLFHGQETFDSFAQYSRSPHVVHDIHIHKDDHIPAAALEEKLVQAHEPTLRICYLGRADAMKGPQDWLDVLELVIKAGIRFEAVWLGEGSELEPMRVRIANSPLADRVHLPGFQKDRTSIMNLLRRAHLMLFCHKTPESPRCLIEALICGTPIVGYESAFPREPISFHGGGHLSPRNNVAALARSVIELAKDRSKLADLIARAAQDGSRFDDDTVFRHRSELIRAHLPRAR